MSGYTIAWIIIVGCTLIGAITFYKWLAVIGNGWVRALLVASAVALFVTPAPVPGYDGQWAPAFLVMVFEAFFQTDGQPATSTRLLLLSLVVMLTLTVLGRMVLLRRQTASND